MIADLHSNTSSKRNGRAGISSEEIHQTLEKDVRNQTRPREKDTWTTVV